MTHFHKGLISIERGLTRARLQPVGWALQYYFIPNLYTAKAMERIDIKIDSSARKVLDLLTPVQNQLQGNNESLSLPSVVLAGLIGVPTPKLNIVIQIAGYRGDIQPFISLGLALKHSSHRSVSQPTRSFKAL